MSTFFKMFGFAGLLAGMLMIGGCGDDNPAQTTTTVATKQTTTTAPIVDGAVPVASTVVAAPAGAPPVAAIAQVSIPATTITSSASGQTLTAAPVVSVSIPVDYTTSGVTATKPTAATPSYAVDSSAGAVDVSFSGASQVTLTNGAEVKIPVITTPDNTTHPEVVSIKADGTSAIVPAAQTSYTAPATGTISATNPGTVTVSNVKDFCWFVVNPHFRKRDNSTGATGGRAGEIGIK
jgi:hypothetical protein